MTKIIPYVPVLLLACAGCDPVTEATDAGQGNRDAAAVDASGIDADGPECTGSAGCDDQVACTDDSCTAGECVNTPDNSTCDTDEVCNPNTGCVLAADACTTEERCVPPAPPLWNGPALRLSASGTTTPSDCPTALSETLATGHVDLTVANTECQCTCTPMNASCSKTSATDYGDPLCGNALGGGALTTSCSSLGGGAPAYRISVPQVDIGTCQKTENPIIPAAERSEARVLCQPADAVSDCTDGGKCLGRLGSGDTYCISNSGDVPCPAGTPYQTREVIYSDVVDNRSCSACTCDGPQGTCTGSAELFNGACDASPDRVVAADGSCRSEVSFDNGRLLIDSVDASCPATPGSPQGAATKSGLVTMCCTTF